jgi:prepilin-type N-terminal cleavage/methylation domain-containing protein
MSVPTRRRGATLLELLVVLAVLGALAVVAVPAPSAPRSPPPGQAAEGWQELRIEAMQHKAPVTRLIALAHDTPPVTVTAWPNGLVLADSAGVTVALRARRSDAER